MATEPKPGDTGESSNAWIPGLGGAIFGGLAGFLGQKEANETNIQLGREQMTFQKEMSNTAYQRAIADMKKAGINPMLVTQVGGANTPSGAMPQVQNAIGAGVSSANQAMNTIKEMQQVEQSEATTTNIKAGTDKIVSETMDKNINTAQRLAETDKTKREAMLKAMQEMTEAQQEQILRAIREGKQTELGEKTIAGSFKADAEKSVTNAELARQELAKGRAEEVFWNSPVGKSMPHLRALFEMMRGISNARGTR